LKKRFSLIKVSPKEIAGCTQIFVPKYEGGLEISRKMPLGQEVAASATDRDLRNLMHHRKLFALLKLCMENMPDKYKDLFKSTEQLLDELKLQAGHVEKRTSLGGKVYFVPKSISFDKMGQSDFAEFYKKIVDVVCKFILPEVSSKKLDEEILNFL